MNLTIDKKGKGEVDKVVDGESTTLTATPNEGWLFRHFVIKYSVDVIEYLRLQENTELYPSLKLYQVVDQYFVELTTIDNPFTIDNPDDKHIVAVFYQSIESYLKGKAGFEITDEALDSIFIDRNIDSYSDVHDLTQKEKDLLYADVLMWGSTLPSSYTGEKESDGGWSHTSSSKTLLKSDKERFAELAKDIYAKYNDPRKSKAKIRIVNLYG